MSSISQHLLQVEECGPLQVRSVLVAADKSSSPLLLLPADLFPFGVVYISTPYLSCDPELPRVITALIFDEF